MIDTYAFGKIVVNGVIYTDDIKIISGMVIPHWRRKSGHLLGGGDVEDILESPTDILVIGTGAYGMMKLTSTLRAYLENKGIECIEKKTSEAIKIFNRLFEDGRQVSAGFHLTC